MSSVNKTELIAKLKEGKTLQAEDFDLLFSDGSVYDSGQMCQIRQGLKNGVDVSKYAVLNKDGEPVYDWSQMAQIRQGLENSVDVSKYAILNKDGKSVYDWPQMAQIRQGLENGVDIFKYTVLNKDGKPVYDGNQMREIRYGLEIGVDVSKYAILNKDGKSVYDWSQMAQIRVGLEDGKDISGANCVRIVMQSMAMYKRHKQIAAERAERVSKGNNTGNIAVISENKSVKQGEMVQSEAEVKENDVVMEI